MKRPEPFELFQPTLIRGSQRDSEKLVQDQRLKCFHSLKDRIICNQTGRLCVCGGGGLQGIGSSQVVRARMRAAKSAISRFGAIQSRLGYVESKP